jgi:hypothetical protein
MSMDFRLQTVCVLRVKLYYSDKTDYNIMGGICRTHGNSKKYRKQFSLESVDKVLSCQALLRFDQIMRAPLQSMCGLDSADLR